VNNLVCQVKLLYPNTELLYSSGDTQLLCEFNKYAEQDSKGLYEALIKAQSIYYNDYGVDITKVYSTSTLSLRIFRQNN
jgi:hypothetical protein